jgi:hypothetical protein
MNQPGKTLQIKLKDVNAKSYNPSEHLAADNEVTVLFNWRDIFKQYIPRKYNALA